MLRTIALILTLIFLTGCKVAVIAVEGGEVQSIASGSCVPAVPGVTGAVCIHEVANTSYSETFTAVPDTGWEFVKWNSGGDFFCKDSTNPTCIVSNVGTAGNAGIEAVVASDATFYIMPIFRAVTLDETLMGQALAINFTPGLLVDELLVEVAYAWLTDSAISLDIEITGINGGFELHGEDVINVVDTSVFSTDGVVAQTVVDWTMDTTTQNVNEVYTVCIQPKRNTTELIGPVKCGAFGPY